MTGSDSADTGSQQYSIISIQSLQLEILAQVFVFCLPNPGRPRLLREAMKTTFTLCNVCSLWRLLAIATPPLWTRFRLCVNRRLRGRLDIDTVVQHIHTWLGRSGIHPLTIEFLYYADPNTGDTLKVIQACRALSVYASRWETVTTDVPLSSWPNLGEVPLLQTLHVFCLLEEVPFTSAPRLAHLVLSGGLRLPWHNITNIPWHQLTAIEVRHFLADDIVLEILRHCSRLESLGLNTGRLGWDAAVAALPILRIEHEALQILNLSLCGNYGSFFESLILPALSSLNLLKWDEQSCYLMLIELFDRSHCELKHLSIANLAFTSNELEGLLAHKSLQKLTSLELRNYRDYKRATLLSDEVIGGLTLDENGGTETKQLLPNLAELSFYRCYSKDSTSGVLGRMILSRCSKARPLSVFNLVTTHDIAKEDKTLLELAKESGLQQLSYTSEDKD